MSLYRLYRPKTFADVAGQDHIVSTLEQAVKRDQVAHAYLFAGSRGTGKTSIARIVARSILTRGMEDEKLQQHILQAIDDGNLVDLIEIDAASNRGIDDIRSLLEKIQFSPVVAPAKVYIVDEVHMLTREAFNALLKTLEEPPSYAYFLLATTELHKIPATIQSRCQRFLFRQIREEDIIRRLQYVADQEHIDIERSALRAIAHHVQGSLRDAIALLDQLRALPTIGLKDVQERIGESGHEYVEQIFTALENTDREALLTITRTLEEMAIPLENIVRLMLGAVREKLRTAVEEKRDTTLLLRTLTTLLTTTKDLRIAPVPGLVLESALLSLCEEAPAASPPSTSKKQTPIVSDKRAVITPIAKSEVAAATAESKDPEPVPVEAPELTLGALRSAWPDIVRTLEPAAVRMSLKNGTLTGLDGSNVRLSFTSAFHRDKSSGLEAARAIEAALERVFKRQLRLRCTLETEDHGTTAQAEVVNLAEAAAEIF